MIESQKINLITKYTITFKSYKNMKTKILVKMMIAIAIMRFVRYKIWTFLFISFFITACKSKNESGPIEKIKIDISKMRVEKIDDLLVESDTILLETNSASLIGSIVKISFVEDKIFIKNSPNKLSVFYETGNFVGNIGMKGPAGYEFVGLSDYFINNDTVFIYDFNGKKILKYEMDGTYINNTRIEQSFGQIWPLPNNEGYIVLNSFGNRKDNPKFSWLDYNFNVIYSSREQRLNSTSFSNAFFQNGVFLDYWEMFNDTIYSVTKESVTPKYIVDFMGYAMPQDIDDISKMIEYYTQNSNRVAGMINNVIETDENVAFMFAHDMASYWALVDKKDNNVRIFRLTGVKEPFGKLNYITTYHNGWFYGVYMPDELNFDDNYSFIRFKIKNP